MKKPSRAAANRCDHPQTTHPDHAAEIHRLNRLRGQLAGIEKMIRERRYCPDILTQTHAVRAAIGGLETAILERHLQHCVATTLAENDRKGAKRVIAELVALFRKQS